MKLYRPVGQKTLWPLNSIYLSISPTNPSTYFGGTWVQLKNAFLFATNATSGNKGTGSGTGTKTGSTTLTTDQIPSHTHKILRNNGYSNNFMIDTGNTGQWGSTINQVSSGYYTAQTMGITVENTGGGQGHTHTIPYIEIYVFKRTA